MHATHHETSSDTRGMNNSMATIPFRPAPRNKPVLSNEIVDVPPPDPLPEQSKSPVIMRIVPFLMGGMMLAFITMMVLSGTRVLSPYQLMAPMGMMMMALAYLGVGGSGGGPLNDLDTNRKNYWLKLREQRRIAHHLGESIHSLHTATYPHPLSLSARCGRPGMWSIKPTDSILPPNTSDKDSPAALRPWLTARVGVGLVEVVPAIEEPQTDVAEKLEPVTAGSFRRFLRTQKFVTNCPLGVSFTEHPAYAFRGDTNAVLALGRAMICSLAYNHSPDHLTIGIICDPSVRHRWDWVKWLPNAQDPHRTDHAGSARYAWPSVASFVSDDELGAAGGHGPHLVVFIDTPGSDVSLPPGWTRASTTLVVLNAPSETVTTKQGRFHVNDRREFSTSKQLRFARADALTVSQARVIAQKMSRHRPEQWAVSDVVVKKDVVKQSYFDVHGIGELETWDPRPQWVKNGFDSHFEIPVGFVHDGEQVTPEIFSMDFAEASKRGTGPHGCFQGKTGSGKSFLLMGVVGSLCVRYGPDKVNLILMDFKGGTTFRGYEKLPHVIANISNLENAADLVARTAVVIRGEIHRRELLMEEYDCKDIVEYREKRAKEPDKYPPLPEVFVIMDEFKEYMELHSEDLKTYIKIGTVGRGWGIHVWPCSQDIDESLLRGLKSHLTFGISLRASDTAHSRFVIRSEAAVDLPMGQGQAIAYRENRPDGDDRERVRFVGFNVEQRYLAPTRAASKRAAQIASGVAPGRRLSRFGLENSFAPDSEATDNEVEDLTAATDLDALPKMKDALVARLAEFDDVKALQLWQPTLRAPISYADITIEPARSPRLEIQIGIADAPFRHKRLPYVITPEDAQAHVRILGQGGSGRSTAVQAIVASALQAYPPQFCSFYLIDYGGAKLAEIADLPNVGGYARKTDEDQINRFIGEFFRVLTIREHEYGRRGVSTLDDYFADRTQTPAEEDPYGHMFLVFDGFPSYLADNEPAKESLLRLLDNGPRHGLHVIVTALANNEIPPRMQKHFGTTIHLAVNDVNESFVSGEEKQMVAKLPANEPGRCVDFARMLEARILVPQLEPIEPVKFERGMPSYDYRTNYGPGIAQFVKGMSARWPQPEQRATKIYSAPEKIDYQVIWDLYARYADRLSELSPPEPGRRSAMDKHLPIAISVENLKVVTVPDHTSPHLLAVGDPKCGKTTFLRTVINSVVNQFSPEEAQFVILETKFDLLTEQEQLAANGYLMAYADQNSLSEAIEKVQAAIQPRLPRKEDGLSSAQIMNRSWYSGPEIFVLIDGVPNFAAGGFGLGSPLDGFLDLMKRNDLGLHIYATGNAQGFPSARTQNKLYNQLAQTNAPVLLFSGPVSEGAIWPGTGIKFARRRRGQAALIDPVYPKPEVIQVGMARPWGEDAHGPERDAESALV